MRAAKGLRDATVARKLNALELAIDAVKKGGWERDLHKEMEEATILLEKVKPCAMNALMMAQTACFVVTESLTDSIESEFHVFLDHDITAERIGEA